MTDKSRKEPFVPFDYKVNFKDCDKKLSDVFGKEAIPLSEIHERLWYFLKDNKMLKPLSR